MSSEHKTGPLAGLASWPGLSRLVPAIHAVRRIECPRVSKEGQNLRICGLLQRATPIRTRICGATAWMGRDKPGHDGSGLEAHSPMAGPTTIAISALVDALIAMVVGPWTAVPTPLRNGRDERGHDAEPAGGPSLTVRIHARSTFAVSASAEHRAGSRERSSQRRSRQSDMRADLPRCSFPALTLEVRGREENRA